MTQTRRSKGAPEADTAEQRIKDLERMLASAFRANEKLQSKMDDQKQQVRELQVRIRQLESASIDNTELKIEVLELKDEVRELTRANREQARRYEVLQLENERLIADAKAQKSNAVLLKQVA